MTSTPRLFVSSRSWKRFLICMIVPLSVLLAVIYLTELSLPIAYVAVMLPWIVLVWVSRHYVMAHHRAGVEKMQAKHYGMAIEDFQKHIAFLEAHPWIDEFRPLTICSSSTLALREMAMTNIAASLLHSGETEGAVEQYHRVLEEYPESPLAVSALDIIQKLTSDSREAALENASSE